MDIQFRHLFYPGNLLTLLRLLLAAPITWLVAHPEAGLDGWLAVLIAVAGVSDALDGYVSRRLGQVTDLGMLLDPLADKVVMASGILAAVAARGFPALVILLLAYRDLLILGLGLIVTRRQGRITKANVWGKLNTNAVALLCLAYVIDPDHALVKALVWVCLVTIVVSGVSYYRLGERVLFRAGLARWAARIALFCAPVGLWLLLDRWFPGLRWV